MRRSPVDVSGGLDAEALTGSLKGMVDRLDDLDGFYRRELPEWWRYRQTLYFASSKIPRNDPKTIALKGSSQPLVETGNLRAATMRNQPFNLGPNDATFGLRRGTPEMKLGVLMYSSPRGAPQRKALLPLNAAERRDVVDMMTDWIMEGAR